jgi:hypothetical protein
MFKKALSSLIIFSLLMTNVTWAGKSTTPFPEDDRVNHILYYSILPSEKNEDPQEEEPDFSTLSNFFEVPEEKPEEVQIVPEALSELLFLDPDPINAPIPELLQEIPQEPHPLILSLLNPLPEEFPQEEAPLPLPPEDEDKREGDPVPQVLPNALPQVESEIASNNELGQQLLMSEQRAGPGDDEANPEEDEALIVPIDVSEDLPPDVRKFLLYVKDQVIDGKLNKKQIAGIFAGVVTGAAVALPLIGIYFDELFELISKENGGGLSFTLIHFTMQVLIGTLGPLLGLDAASRTMTLLGDLFEQSVQLFSLQKSKSHLWALRITKGGLYFGSFLAAALPLYYFYQALAAITNLDPVFYFMSYCPMLHHTAIPTEGDGTFFILLKDNDPCYVFLGFFGFFLVLDTVLQYGSQLSHGVERRINAYFSRKVHREVPLGPDELKRHSYLQQFKDIKRMIYALDEKGLENTYDVIFVKCLNKENQNRGIRVDDIKEDKTLKVLAILQSFHRNHLSQLTPEEVEDLKNTWASRFGWGISILATVGRAIVFWYIINSLLKNFDGHWTGSTMEAPNATNQIFSIIFGGIIANLIQGVIEQEALHQGFYDISMGKKIPDATSHPFLRRGLKTWHYLLFGPFNTLPYVLTLLDATTCWNEYDTSQCSSSFKWPLWTTILIMVPFVIADAFNNATAFNQSYGNFISAFDSAVSYVHPFKGYKRDKLLRMTRQLRRLFKNLRPDVLEAVDQQLKERKFDLPAFLMNHDVEGQPEEVLGEEDDPLLNRRPSMLNSLGEDEFYLINSAADEPDPSFIFSERKPKSFFSKLWNCCKKKRH